MIDHAANVGRCERVGRGGCAGDRHADRRKGPAASPNRNGFGPMRIPGQKKKGRATAALEGSKSFLALRRLVGEFRLARQHDSALL
jgi:hypothetical protein